MLHIAMATHSLKGTLTNRVLKISDDVTVTSFLNQSQQNFVFLFAIPRGICAKFEQNRTRNKEVIKIENDVIVTSFLKIALQFFVCEYFLVIPIDVPSFKLIEGQIKEL